MAHIDALQRPLGWKKKGEIFSQRLCDSEDESSAPGRRWRVGCRVVALGFRAYHERGLPALFVVEVAQLPETVIPPSIHLAVLRDGGVVIPPRGHLAQAQGISETIIEYPPTSAESPVGSPFTSRVG